MINIIILGLFKYTNFFIENFNYIFVSNIGLLNLIFPLGLSFYTIQQISYLIDCSEGEIKKTNLIKYFTFVSFFPQLIAGPIILYKDFLKKTNLLEIKKKAKINKLKNNSKNQKLFKNLILNSDIIIKRTRLNDF